MAETGIGGGAPKWRRRRRPRQFGRWGYHPLVWFGCIVPGFCTGSPRGTVNIKPAAGGGPRGFSFGHFSCEVRYALCSERVATLLAPKAAKSSGRPPPQLRYEVSWPRPGARPQSREIFWASTPPAEIRGLVASAGCSPPKPRNFLGVHPPS
jgi:hypothetical protein